jgi:hypothetical protein
MSLTPEIRKFQLRHFNEASMLVNFRKGATGLMALVRDGGADPPSLARAAAPVHRQRLAHLPSRKSPRRGTTRPERPRLRPLSATLDSAKTI